MSEVRQERPLRARLFGPPSVEVHGQPLPRLRTRKMLSLLAFLLLQEGREVERAFLAALLWTETDEPTALATLRRGLTDLRAALGPAGPFLVSPSQQTLRF